MPRYKECTWMCLLVRVSFGCPELLQHYTGLIFY